SHSISRLVSARRATSNRDSRSTRVAPRRYSKQGKPQCGPAPFEPIQSISGFGFDSSRRDGDELFSRGKVRLAAAFMPDVRDSAQFLDSNTATSRNNIQ